MKALTISIIFGAVALSSCSSASHTTQSTDDLYYSQGSRSTSANKSNNNGEYYNANPNDQYLMMKAQDPARWSAFDDYSYDGFYSPYYNYSPYFNFGYGLGFYSPFMTFGYWGNYYSCMNSYYMWNTFYNPYYYGVIIVNPHYPSFYNAYTGLHPFNVNAYRKSISRNSLAKSFYTPTNSRNSYNNGSFNRNNPAQRTNNFNNSSNYQPVRSFSPSSFGGGSRGGGGFSRGGKG